MVGMVGELSGRCRLALASQGVNGRVSGLGRANEHLVPADAAVIRFRRLLLEADRAIEEDREAPARGGGLDFPAVRAAAAVVAADARG